VRSFPVAPYLLVLLAFTLLTVFVSNNPQPAFDLALLDAVQGMQAPFLDPAMRAISFLGETSPSIIVAVPFVIWLWARGFRREAIGFMIVLLLAAAVTSGIKNLIDRTRPDGGELSFVSGHTSHFAVFSAYLYIELKKIVSERRWLTAWRIGLVTLVVLTGISRVYLDAHWPTDVLGGFMLGMLVLVPVLWRIDKPARIAT
jgi:undecaprenyl-diphosphatase